MPKSKRKKRRSNSKSGFFGVANNGNKYTAKIYIDRKIKYLGSSYDTAKQAAEAYEKVAIKLRRPFSSLNFPKKAPVGYTSIQKALAITNTRVWFLVYDNLDTRILRIFLFFLIRLPTVMGWAPTISYRHSSLRNQ